MDATNFKIRKAEAKDKKFLFDLRNEKTVRAFSLHQEPISFETHSGWFEKKLASPDSVIYIAEVASRPIAQTRYDIHSCEAEASIALIKKMRGKGLGTEILKETARVFLDEHPEVKQIHAFINVGNIASFKSFVKAGYKYFGDSKEGGILRHEMILYS